MKHILLSLTLLGIITSTAYCQHDFLFEKKTLNFLRHYEDSIHSKNLGFVKTNVSDNYFPTAKGKHDYYPLNYIRTNDSFFPELHIEYFYDEKDSTLLATSYDWNIMDYVKNIMTDGDRFEKEQKREKEYLAQYNAIKQELITKYGQPTTIQEEKSEDGYFYSLNWKKDAIDILVLLKFSIKLKSFPNNMKFGSYNIRVKVDYNK